MRRTIWLLPGVQPVRCIGATADGPFLPDPVDPARMARFCGLAKSRFGLPRAEAETVYVSCCGHTGNQHIARRRGGILPSTVRETKRVLFGRLHLRCETQAVVLLWPTYRDSAREAAD